MALAVLCVLVLAGCGDTAGLSDPTGGIGLGEVPVGTPTIVSIGVANQSGSTIVFESARLVPEAGFRTPRLLKVRRATCCELAEGGGGHRPSPRSAGARGLRPLRGTRLISGTRSEATLALDLMAPHGGDYGFSAVEITARKNGHTVTFASSGGYVVACVGSHPSAASCPGVHALTGGGSSGAYAGWLKNEANISGNGTSASVRRAFPLLGVAPTVTTPHRSARELDEVPIGSTMDVSDTPLTAGGDDYLGEDYSPGTVVEVLYHRARVQIYADDYYGTVGILSSEPDTGEYRSGPDSYAFTDSGSGPNFIYALVPSPVHRVQIWFADGRRRSIPVVANAASYVSDQPFAMTYPMSHGQRLFLQTVRYRGPTPANANL